LGWRDSDNSLKAMPSAQMNHTAIIARCRTEATDLACGLLSVHTYENLVVNQGWSIEQFVSRLTSMLKSVLVVQPEDSQQ
jgi:hypothetical protein